jgi:CubicO group peptidase (beta-lactamase class C family)
MMRNFALTKIVCFGLAIACSFSHAMAALQDDGIVRLDGTSISKRQMDDTVNRLIADAHVTGAGVAIFHDGYVAYLKGYGLRDTEKALPLTPDSVMTAASLSKAAFATLVMRLVQVGVLDLDKPISLYLPKPLPDYPSYADLRGDERYKKLTLRMLLSHTSGFANWRGFEPDHKLKIHFEPGSRYAYSGEGIDLAQFVVETVIGKSDAAIMSEHIFMPLQMPRTSMVWEPRFESNFANGYDEYGRSLGPERRSRPDAAGSMQTTLHDYANFLSIVMRQSFLTQKTTREMFSPQIKIHSLRQFPTLAGDTTTGNDAIQLSYGLGWGLYSTSHHQAFFKEGHDEGWRHLALCFSNGTGILIMTNSSNGEGIFKSLIDALLGETKFPFEWEGYTPYNLLPPLPPLKQHKDVPITAAQLRRLPGKYVLAPGIVMTVIAADGHLFVQENDEPKQEIHATGPADFYSIISSDELSFEPADGDVAETMVLHIDGKDMRAKRQPQ